MAQPVKFYYDFLSQHCRALYMFMEASKIPYEAIPISLLKGEHLSKEYKENVNRFQKVPAIIDHGFKLSGSAAIFRHLVREKLVPDHWYPRNSLTRCRIDEYFDWKRDNLSRDCNEFFQSKFQHPSMTKNTEKINEKTFQEIAKRLEKSLSDFEEHWIKSDKFMFGPKITIADVTAITDIDQTKMVGYDPLNKRKKLISWYDLVREALEPFYQEASQVVDKVSSGKIDDNSKASMKI